MSPQSTMPAPLHVAIVTHAVDRNDGQGRGNHEIAAAALAAGCEVTWARAGTRWVNAICSCTTVWHGGPQRRARQTLT
ncbi:hypothetical protein [Sorangium sp. So ce1000]|uniref:hypothetical protein n=1 Tax=Sorangium sp. So ce1000 TaxID=3133325 RepID=UPI003F62866C